MAVPNMIVTLVANTTKYANGLRSAAGETQKFGKAARIGFAVARNAILGIGTALIAVIPKLANMGAESRRADIQLKFMLENMEGIGVATNNTVKRMAEYAKRVAFATGIDDEQVKTVQKKLLMFKSVRKSADEMGGSFDRATDAAIDLAAAGFGEMETNAVRLGRMLENPLKNLDAMNRAGVVFSDTEKKKIQELVKSGKLLQAQDIILESIENRVGGLAEESATPFEKMMQRFADIGDTIGEEMLIPLEKMNEEIDKWISSPQGKKDVRELVDAFVSIANALREGSNFARDTKKFMDDITANNKWFFDLIRNWAVDTFNLPSTPTPSGELPIVADRPRASGITVNFNAPVDSVAAGREVARVLADYDRARGRA